MVVTLAMWLLSKYWPSNKYWLAFELWTDNKTPLRKSVWETESLIANQDLYNDSISGLNNYTQVH